MKTNLTAIQNVFLMVSGTLLIVIGMSIFLSTDDFYSSNNIDIEANVSLLNELKASAGLLLAAGIFIIYSVFKKYHNVGLKLTMLIYLSYAGARGISIVADGVPASGLVLATLLEAAIGLISLLLLLTSSRSINKVV
ncbi:MAG: DUF4345 domain-containing protein [Granulosicoccus sp.]